MVRMLPLALPADGEGAPRGTRGGVLPRAGEGLAVGGGCRICFCAVDLLDLVLPDTRFGEEGAVWDDLGVAAAWEGVGSGVEPPEDAADAADDEPLLRAALLGLLGGGGGPPGEGETRERSTGVFPGEGGVAAMMEAIN